MKRSELKRKTGIKATGFKRKVPVLAPSPEPDEHRPHPELAPRPAAKPRKQLRQTRAKSTAIRRSARDEECTLRIRDVCNHLTDTTVLCHSNSLADGKGMGLKAPDTKACYGCSACHDVMDGRAPLPAWMNGDRSILIAIVTVAIVMTQRKINNKGLIK